MTERELTGEIAFRIHGPVLGRQVVVLQVEERVKRYCGNNIIPLFEQDSTRFRDATPEEAELLKLADTSKPLVDEMRRLILEAQ